MATGNDTLDKLMGIVRSFFPEDMEQQWTYQHEITSDEPGSSPDSLMKIDTDELVGFDESLRQPDLSEDIGSSILQDISTSRNDETLKREDEVIQDRLMDQNNLNKVTLNTSMPSVPSPHYSNKPYVVITEQPAPRCLRFRYECEIEGRSAGSIVGVHSTAEVRTYPTIQVMNYQGTYVVVVSCVTKDGPPYRPHPHNLVGREGCKRGVCTLIVKSPDMKCSFTSLGIQCVKKKGIVESLQERKKHNYDPFKTGFEFQPGSIDLSVLRLCFQVFIPGSDSYYSKPLPPVVSEPIYDKKAMSDLAIMKLSHCSAPAPGGTEVILLCDRVSKDDIQIWFYEGRGTRNYWEIQADFQPSAVHKQVAISFRTPPYRYQNIREAVQVFIELRKPSDRTRGEPREFYFLPVERDPEGISHKKRKIPERKVEECPEYLRIFPVGFNSEEYRIPVRVPRTVRQPILQRVKAQPRVEGMSDLTILKLSQHSAPASGGTQVILSCNRVAKDDIQIWFYEGRGTRNYWEIQAEFQPSDVHEQVAISFRTPPYRDQNIRKAVQVFIELRKPTDRTKGEPREFYFLSVERGLNTNEDRFVQPPTSFADCSNPTISTTVPISTEDSSPFPHLTPAQAPASSSAQSHAFRAPPLTAIPSPFTQQKMEINQLIDQALIESSEPCNVNEGHDSDEDAIVEQFDSLGLLDLDINLAQNLSVSLYDSSIMDSTYQHNPSATDQQ